MNTTNRTARPALIPVGIVREYRRDGNDRQSGKADRARGIGPARRDLEGGGELARREQREIEARLDHHD